MLESDSAAFSLRGSGFQCVNCINCDHLTPIRTIKHSRGIAAPSIQQQTAIAQPQNFDSPYIADYEKHQPWLQQVIETSVYPLLGILFISQRAYSAIPGEYGAIAAGFVSSYMIGAIYFSPLALDIKQIRKSNSFNYKLAFSIMLGIFAAIVISLIASNQIAIMVTTSNKNVC